MVPEFFQQPLALDLHTVQTHVRFLILVREHLETNMKLKFGEDFLQSLHALVQRPLTRRARYQKEVERRGIE